MNYLAHAWPLLQAQEETAPYVLAGVATPDWLGVAARRVKCRSRQAAPWVEDSDPRVAAVARGVVRHHADDGWFHESRAFNELSLAFAKRMRETLGERSSLRPWFLGHILVELLLDDSLARRDPGALDRYYSTLARADASLVADAVQRMCGRPIQRLEEWILRFLELRFLEDYASDEGLTLRLNQVMGRVGLPALPAEFLAALPACRADVERSVAALMLAPEAAATNQ